ncbi:MAG: hypothetical protein IJA83_08380 [Clostridia bacterium]|nr:hypothetical protein [Clostridia bacterium]
MQQLYLSGAHAADLADQLFTALNIRPAGYRLQPFTVGGTVRGETMHLLLPPAAPMDNDVPCRIRLRENDWCIVPRALEEIAAPNLLRASAACKPILLGGLTAQMLTCPAFREAVVTLLTGPRPVIVACEDAAEEHLRALTPADTQLWAAVPESADGRAELLRDLVAEAALRL